MNWKPIVAGIDPSDEGIRAAIAAVNLAQAAKTECILVHAIRDPAKEVFYTEIPLNFEELNRSILESSRTLLTQLLEGKVPSKVIQKMECRFGPPSIVLAEVANERDAELIVLGGKHHSALGRWLAGSTVHHMARILDRPILVVGPTGTEGRFSRVLLAVDLSHAAKPTIDAAERIAGLFDAKLRALHVIEPIPWAPELAPVTYEEMIRESEEQLERSVWPNVLYPGVERMTRRGVAPDTIAATAIEWKADLVVVGTHGRNWVDRILIGSVTERLLSRLPTSMLVIPVSAPATKASVRVRQPAMASSEARG